MIDDLFFDTDCLSAFLWINNTNILHELYGGRIVLPEPVYQELSNPSIPHIKQRADSMIASKDISVKTIETDTEEYIARPENNAKKAVLQSANCKEQI